uniref:Histone H3 K4-specific methyltransferase SET7/9 family protein n=1 Tax=Tanacetum cinerariifolium TaxID=118510 RepID=A0A6L2NRF1_TANCI|nr:histone H3 K4-specific methyltransferase SET7/9 family protein [Tanacetum cinerariifolium]
MHGFGVYCFANGHRYESAWHEGRRQGCVMYTFRNGDTQSGYWDNGVLTISTSQDTSQAGSSSTTISHAKVLNAVQEARRIAVKAVLTWMRGCTKGVSAANRAANASRVAAVKAIQKRMHDLIDDRPIQIV